MNEREAGRSSRAGELLVLSAPAGSGKTTRLVCEYLRCVSTLRVESVVAITFTRKAAAELVDRAGGVLSALAEERSLSDRQRELVEGVDLTPVRAREVLALLPSAPVSTVDSFVLSLLQAQLLDAALPLPSGARILVDGPLELETHVDDVYRVAARQVLEALSDDARRLLSQVSVRDASADLAALARHPTLQPLSGHRLNLELAHALDAEAAHLLAHLPVSQVNNAAKSAHEAVTAWLLTRQTPPPDGLLLWLMLMHKKSDAGELRNRLLGEVLAPLELSHVAALCESLSFDEAWAHRDTHAASDALAESLVRLASATRERALSEMAARGRLGYDEMLVAATELCRTGALQGRYHALLVDEVQDTNPAQLAFYSAFRAQGKLRSVFVGDVRQSIYRFRAADPHGWGPLLDEAREQGALEELTLNYRSSQLLVRAQRLLVEALRELRGDGLRSLEGLRERPGAPTGLFDGRAPVALIDAEDPERVLAHFAQRVQARWEHAPEESAAVLVPSWVMGRRAVEQLRRMGLRAQLWGERALLESRVAKDLRIWIQALLDPTDGVSVAGLLKHPSIGLSDGELLALARGPGWAAAFSDGPVPEKLAQARPALIRAQKELGRQPTADVLETLIEALHWRPLLAAGPDGFEALAPGEGLAQLELLLDLIRGLEERGTDPCHALDVLTADPSRQEDLPPVRLHAGEQTVEVVTLHGAKGLAWDHVALLDVDHSRGGGLNSPRTFKLARVGGKTYLGVRRDPSGALHPSDDPCCRLLALHEENEEKAEQLRELYVGFTRARSSVTLGLGEKSVVREALLSRREELGEALEVVAALGVNLPPDRPGYRPPTTRQRGFVRQAVVTKGWQLTQPTALSEELPPEVSREILERLQRKATLSLGVGSPPFPEHPLLRSVPENVLGELTHGWLEAWGFASEVSVERASSYLHERWGLEDAPDVKGLLAQWLVQAGLAVRDRLPGFSTLLEAKLHFEWPLLGRLGEHVVTGRTDLVVEKPDGGWVIIDFKAGPRVAHSVDDIPGFAAYALQLDAYRRLLAATGRRVDEVGLLYVRSPGPTWVRIPLADNSAVSAIQPSLPRRQLSLFDEPR